MGPAARPCVHACTAARPSNLWGLSCARCSTLGARSAKRFRDHQPEDRMPTLISQPTRIAAAGNKPKLIDEFIGHVNSQTGGASVAHMRSPGGWQEPGQTPEFD